MLPAGKSHVLIYQLWFGGRTSRWSPNNGPLVCVIPPLHADMVRADVGGSGSVHGRVVTRLAIHCAKHAPVWQYALDRFDVQDWFHVAHALDKIRARCSDFSLSYANCYTAMFPDSWPVHAERSTPCPGSALRRRLLVCQSHLAVVALPEGCNSTL